MPTIDPRKIGFHSDGTVTLGCNACGFVFPRTAAKGPARNARLKHLGANQTVGGVDVCPMLQVDGFEAASKGGPQTKVCGRVCARVCARARVAAAALPDERVGGGRRGVWSLSFPVDPHHPVARPLSPIPRLYLT
jgi:hypothetical protein